jgi:diphosphomevalonate decarboxylase
MNKVTVKSPANIAFIKYWGKADPKIRVPQNNSISMCLSDLYSICTVEFNERLREDQIEFLEEKVVEKKELGRMVEVLDRVRAMAGFEFRAKVRTKNNFPKATGIASSASGLSAITMAAVLAAGLSLSEEELSKLARLASGTASRSIPEGFVEWEKGTNESNSYAQMIYTANHWKIADVVAIVTHEMKKVSSSDGHAIADTSPFYQARMMGMDEKIADIKGAMMKKDFTKFGLILEREALNMHAICLTSKPPILYWEAPTMAMMRKIEEWRDDRELESYYTIDAGPTVHAICQEKDAEELAKRLAQIAGVQRVVINRPAQGAHPIEEHLF